MHIIIKELVDEKGFKGRPEIADGTVGTIKEASTLLLHVVKKYIKSECGTEIANESKIIDIKTLDQICEPLVDTILIYRLDNDPSTLYLYRRKTKIVPGTIWGQTTISEFRLIQVYTLLEFEKYDVTKSEELTIEMIPAGPSKILIPKQYTIAPLVNLIAELKTSKHFIARQNMENNCVNIVNKESNIDVKNDVVSKIEQTNE